MTLREQIQKEIFFKIGGHGRLPWNDVNKCTDEVIKLFVSKLDSRIQGIKATNHWNDNEDSSHFCDCDEFEDYAIWMELEDLKKELRE